MPGQLPKAVVQERYERLIAEQDAMAWAEAKTLVGCEVEVLVTAHDGRKDAATGRVSGRARDGRLVHVSGRADPGDVITAEITYAAPHHLVADAGITVRRPWRGGQQQPAHRPLLTVGPRPTG
jgi:tRNA-2-methylthio-N6-dimethylallyladenosine synthase